MNKRTSLVDHQSQIHHRLIHIIFEAHGKRTTNQIVNCHLIQLTNTMGTDMPRSDSMDAQTDLARY